MTKRAEKWSVIGWWWHHPRNIIRGGLDIVTNKTKKKINRRQSKKPLSLRLRGLKKFFWSAILFVVISGHSKDSPHRVAGSLHVDRLLATLLALLLMLISISSFGYFCTTGFLINHISVWFVSSNPLCDMLCSCHPTLVYDALTNPLLVSSVIDGVDRLLAG